MEETYFTIKQIAGGQEEAAAEAAVTLEVYRRLLALGGISKHLRGINMQQPWARMILDGQKTVEARTYELTTYLNEDLWIIETLGNAHTFVARIIGIVRFGSSFQYTELVTGAMTRRAIAYLEFADTRAVPYGALPFASEDAETTLQDSGDVLEFVLLR